MSLNVQEIKGFRVADKSYKKYDSRGLLLLVKPNGSKLWYFKYRFGGKEKKLPIPKLGKQCWTGRRARSAPSKGFES